MTAYDVERWIGGALLLAVGLWFAIVVWLCRRDDRRARWLADEADADEFVRSLREHPAGNAIVVPPSPVDRRFAVLERRAAWLRRRIAERPEVSSFDRRELDALEWALSIARAYSGARS